jgi:hypothetical protein
MSKMADSNYAASWCASPCLRGSGAVSLKKVKLGGLDISYDIHKAEMPFPQAQVLEAKKKISNCDKR